MYAGSRVPSRSLSCHHSCQLSSRSVAPWRCAKAPPPSSSLLRLRHHGARSGQSARAGVRKWRSRQRPDTIGCTIYVRLRRDIITAAPFSSPLLHHAHHHCCHMLITAAAPCPSLINYTAATDAKMHSHEHGGVTVAPRTAAAPTVTRAEATLAAATEATPASMPGCSTSTGGSIGNSRSREQAGEGFRCMFPTEILH